MKRLLLCLGTASLLAATGCEMHPPATTDDHGGHGAPASEKAPHAEATPAPGATSPQFFPNK